MHGQPSVLGIKLDGYVLEELVAVERRGDERYLDKWRRIPRGRESISRWGAFARGVSWVITLMDGPGIHGLDLGTVV